MKEWGKFYLDKEKDVIVYLYCEDGKMSYILRTPNHGTGNLISNFAQVCGLETESDENGIRIICGDIPCYYDGDYRKVYILRMGNTKVANIYPDGKIERKAYIPAIAKTLMSQTKDYTLDINKTLVKTYIREELKFHSDLHTHRSANLTPDILIALGIKHQLRYPYYYIKKLGLRITSEQKERLEAQRAQTALRFSDSGLKGKYLDRRIDDNTEINFADLILCNEENNEFNIPRIRASLAVMKDGQAVFTNLEKVYLYRYVFTKGSPAYYKIELCGEDKIPDADIVNTLARMKRDKENPAYADNTLYQDKLLWTARSYASQGVTYAEISDTALLKKSEAASTLKEIHGIMPAATAETGVTLRFLAAFRRIPLTIIKDQITQGNYFTENLQVLKAVAMDPYIAGSDFVGEEINDIRELKPVIGAIMKIASGQSSYVMRIHAGENDSLPDNVRNSIMCVEDSMLPGQKFPHVRIGHGLYTANLKSEKGKELLEELIRRKVVLEFQISSNVRLNNLSRLDRHPLKQYIKAGVLCVQGTDGGTLYGTDPIDEQLSLERMLELDYDDMKKMRQAEDDILSRYMREFEEKKKAFFELCSEDVEYFYSKRIECELKALPELSEGTRKYDSAAVLKEQIRELPQDKIPFVIAGGSFNNASHVTRIRQEECRILDRLISKADPEKTFFVIGPSVSGYEKYVLEKARDRFEVFGFVPAEMTLGETKKIIHTGLPVRVALESSSLGVYKSFAFEIFKRRQSVIIAMDGNSAAANLIQDAKNSKYKSRTFVNPRSKELKSKAESLQGYMTWLSDEKTVEDILSYADKYYEALTDPNAQILKRNAKIV